MPLSGFAKRSGVELAVIGTALAALGLANYLVLRPFLPAILWAIILAVATWPLLQRLRALLGQRQRLAVALLVLGLLVVIAVPSTLLIFAVLDSAPLAFAASRQALQNGLPALPVWVTQLPMVGTEISNLWSDWTLHPDHLIDSLEPYGQRIFGWLTGSVTSVGLAMVNLLLVIVFTTALYLHGEAMLANMQLWARRFGGSQADTLLELTAQTLRGVALGVVGTALVQSLLAALAFAVSGMPHVAILLVITLLSAVVQVGAAPVVALAALWHYWQGHIGWAIALGVWTLVVGGLDNILRPLLIRQGVELPLWLIFAGVIGGLLAFGIVGLFVGPVVLALSHRIARQVQIPKS